jgi:uncharacterized protein YbaP (TraB family)
MIKMKPSRQPIAGASLLFWLLLGALRAGVLPAAEASLERALLFEVRYGQGDPSYLFGTIHSEDPRVMDLPPRVLAAFESADAFVMEVVPDAEAIIRSMVTMVYTDGRSLKGVIGDGLYREVIAAMKERGMAEAAFKDFKPWAVVTLLSVPPAETGEFLDMYLYKSAVAGGRPVIGLETIDEQLAVFEDLSEADQVALLGETLEVREQLPSVYERLVGAYVDRDLAELMRLSEEYLRAGDSELGERFKAAALDVRNKRMADRMEPLLRKGNHFVAVGALHLPGDGGILDRLLAAGFDLRSLY